MRANIAHKGPVNAPECSSETTLHLAVYAFCDDPYSAQARPEMLTPYVGIARVLLGAGRARRDDRRHGC